MSEGFLKEEKKFKVEFFDVDSMSVAWHGNYVKYMEIGRCALLDSIGYSYNEMVKDGYVFPVVEIKIKYLRSLVFDETATIVSSLIEYENRLRIKYEIYNEKGELATKAESNQMVVRMSTGETLFECPPLFLERVKKAIENRGVK